MAALLRKPKPGTREAGAPCGEGSETEDAESCGLMLSYHYDF